MQLRKMYKSSQKKKECAEDMEQRTRSAGATDAQMKLKLEGVCSGHGATRKLCSKEECTNIALKGGVCKRHGATKR
jgi:hypothetical protein